MLKQKKIALEHTHHRSKKDSIGGYFALSVFCVVLTLINLDTVPPNEY